MAEGVEKSLPGTRIRSGPYQLPYYLLIVGPPERISLAFQCELDVAYAVGRITLDRSEDYTSYARNVIRGEAKRHQRPRVVAFGAKNNDDLTAMSERDLIVPLAEKIAPKRRRGKLDWELESIVAREAKQRIS